MKTICSRSTWTEFDNAARNSANHRPILTCRNLRCRNSQCSSVFLRFNNRKNPLPFAARNTYHNNQSDPFKRCKQDLLRSDSIRNHQRILCFDSEKRSETLRNDGGITYVLPKHGFDSQPLFTLGKLNTLRLDTLGVPPTFDITDCSRISKFPRRLGTPKMVLPPKELPDHDASLLSQSSS